MEQSRIAVLGAGTMGRGIIESAIVHGLAVHALEENDQRCTEAENAIRKSIEKGIARGTLDLNNPDDALSLVEWHTDLEKALSGVQLVIEAVTEREDLKLDLFRRIDVCLNSANQPDVILASNTSSISITKLAAATRRPENVVGMHFFNPVPVMKPVEIVQGIKTSPETIERVHGFARKMGKQSFVVGDSPGFVVNRILMPLINEAVFTLQENVADAETIDSLMKLGCNHPMGPLQLADLIGLDVCLSILQVLHRELSDPKFRPCPLLAEMVDAGRLGRKTGHGFYTY
ncbi:MAG: 3-hydroxybutyryl-CoA dehydrogenase [Planctomycetes bacterium]|nr:3-hydroxybutyryl-CoA dehydrogenase [Planctomycetota bacterium]